MVLRDATHLKRKNNVAVEGIVEVGSSNEMSAVVLDQRVCTGRPLLERKNLRRSLGNCCRSRRWLRKTAFSSILSRMITPMPGSHSNQCNASLCVAYFDFSALLSVTHSKDLNCTDYVSV